MPARRAPGPAPGGNADGPRLGDVLASLAVLELVCAPRGLDVAVGETVIHDPASPPAVERGAIVLGVGTPAASPDATDLVSNAGSADAAAVVLKLAGDTPETLLAAANRAGIAILGLPAEMTWSQVHSLVRTAVGSARASEAEAGGVPLGDLFALANAVATMIGGAVTIEDRHSRVLAYSSQNEGIDEPRRQTILGRRVPDEWLSRLEEAGVFRALWAGEVVRYQAGPDFELRPRLAVAVRAGDEILGSIWVAEGDKPLGEGAEDALREAARIAALHLIRHRSSERLERTMRGEVLRSILDGRGPGEAAAYRLGVAVDEGFAVLAFEPQLSDEVEGALESERALDLVTLYGQAFRQRSAAAQVGRTIYVLLPGPDATRPERLVDLATDIVQRARSSLRAPLRAGIGGIVTHLSDVQRSRHEADQVLRALASGPDAGLVADFASARARVTLIELRDFLSERPHLRSERLSMLAAHDAAHGTSYVDTLRAYLDAFGDIPRASQLACVHPNTFRYRLKRLAELCGFDPNDPDERLLAALELRTREIGS